MYERDHGVYSLGAALRTIFLSVLLISGGAWAIWGGYYYFWSARAYDPKYEIVAIVQTGPEKEALKTPFLAELMKLSADRPINLYQLNLQEATKLLLSFPLIKEAVLKRIPPGTLYVDYTIRKPIAFIGDFTNTAVDQDLYLIPFKPFFSPKNLPEVILGGDEQTLRWGDRLSGASTELAFRILNRLKNGNLGERLLPTKLDLSKADAPSLGEQRIVLVIEEHDHEGLFASLKQETTLILNPYDVEEGLQRYVALREVIGATRAQKMTVDLRLAELGFVRSN